jgi:hypothetical protein
VINGKTIKIVDVNIGENHNKFPVADFLNRAQEIYSTRGSRRAQWQSTCLVGRRPCRMSWGFIKITTSLPRTTKKMTR